MASRKFIVWNSTGLDKTKSDMLAGWISKYKIDLIVLIEGGQDAAVQFPGVKGATKLTSIKEKCEVTGNLTVRDDEASIQAVLGPSNRILKPVGGKSTFHFYAVTPGLKLVDDNALVNYEESAPVRKWIFEALDGLVTDDDIAAKGKKRLATVSIDPTSKERATRRLTRRVALLGHRRPKGFEVDGLAVYMWHSPLGGEVHPDDASLQISGQGCGGDDAKYLNWLFAKHLGSLPAKSLLVGDLNMDWVAVKAIYGVSPAVSSVGKWCHAVPGSGVNITEIEALPYVASMGDHAPIVFRATW